MPWRCASFAAAGAAAHHVELCPAPLVDPHPVAALAPAAALDARCVGLALHQPRAAVDRQLALAVALVLRSAHELETLRWAGIAAAPAEAVQADVAGTRRDEAGAIGHAATVVARLDVELPAVARLLEIAGRDDPEAASLDLAHAVALRRTLRPRLGEPDLHRQYKSDRRDQCQPHEPRHIHLSADNAPQRAPVYQ